MSKTIKLEALIKKVKADLKLIASYAYEEWAELGGLKKLLTDVVTTSDEMTKLEEGIKLEQERLAQQQEKREQENRLEMKKMTLLGRKKSKLLDDE